MTVEIVFHEDVFDDLMDNEAAEDLAERGERVAERQRELINDRTGRLSRSVEATKPERVGDDVALAVGSDLFYAGFVNDGTAHSEAVPFVEPSAEAAK